METKQEKALKSMTVGMTTSLWDNSVTRWSETSWEVGTWGRKTQSLADAVKELK